MTNYQFYRSLHARGLTQGKLAQLAGTGRAHLSEVLSGKTGHGHFTRKRLFPYLTRLEVRLLGWDAEYKAWASTSESSTRNNVPVEADPASAGRRGEARLA